MPQLCPTRIQLSRELDLRETVRECAKEHGLEDIEKLHARHSERQFASIAQNALCVTDLSNVRSLIDQVASRVKFDFDVHVFVLNQPVANAMVFPRKYFDGSGKGKQSVVIVSQHFFNDLTHDEQLFVLGHEIGHIIFEHHKVPATLLLSDSNLNLGGSRADVAAYSICCEISCDLIGLIATDFDQTASLRAMAKITTGLTSQSIEQIGMEQLGKLFRDQFESLSSASIAAEASSHPLTPSRVEVLRRFCESDFVASFREGVSADEPVQHREAIDDLVASTLRDIYPDLDNGEEWKFEKQALAMAWAVAMSDGIFQPSEEVFLKQTIPSDLYGMLETSFGQPTQERSLQLVDQVVEVAKAAEMGKPDAIRVLRRAALAAQIDGEVVADEMATMHHFGQNFGIDKHEVITIAKSRWSPQSF